MTKTRDLADLGGGFIQAGTGAVQRTVESKLQDVVSVKDFGAVGDGVADDTAAIQAAITSLGTKGGVVTFPQERYKISSTLIAEAGVLLKCATRQEISTSTDGDSTAVCTIKWAGAANAPMYEIRPAVVGNIIFGGGAENIEWDGNGVATAGIHLNNTKYSSVSGKARNVTFAGLWISSYRGRVGNFSMKNQVTSWEFTWSIPDNAACAGAHGILMEGNANNVPSTQQFVGNVFGLVKNGYLVKIAETDNAQLQSVHAVVSSGGTGGAVRLVNAGAQPSHHNVFLYTVGPINLDNGLIGNTFVHYNSEGGGIAQTGTSSWHGTLVDYVTGEFWQSPKYLLAKKLTIPSGSFVGDISTGRDPFCFQWNCISLNNAAQMRASCIIPAPYDLNNGYITRVEFIVGTNGTSGGNLRLRYALSTGTSSFAAITPEADTTVTVASGAQYTPNVLQWIPSPSLAFTFGDYIFLAITRFGADALDTNSDNLMLLGANIYYKAIGPQSSGSGTYQLPNYV